MYDPEGNLPLFRLQMGSKDEAVVQDADARNTSADASFWSSAKAFIANLMTYCSFEVRTRVRTAGRSTPWSCRSPSASRKDRASCACACRSPLQLLLLMHVIASLVRLNVYGVVYLVLLGLLMLLPRHVLSRGARQRISEFGCDTRRPWRLTEACRSRWRCRLGGWGAMVALVSCVQSGFRTWRSWSR